MASAEREGSIRRWLADRIDPAVERSLQRLAGSPGVRHLAVMPDVHLAEEVCVGVVVATERHLYPAAVGGDIGCGMAAIGLEADAALIKDERAAARLLSALAVRAPALKLIEAGARAELPEELERAPLSAARLERMKGREGRLQLGTLGRGNHFLELQADQQQRLWLMLHSGSRAIGPAIRDHHLDHARHDGGLPWLDAESDAGRAYVADQLWAVRYAELGRRRMVERVCELLRELLSVEADWTSFFQCDHNHVRRETHFGEELWVHRKGALAAHPGVRGMIPGSMGAPSYHVTGRGHAPALCSSSHGAGRRMSRSEARRRVPPRRLEQEMEGILFDHRRARQLCDEAPSAYREIDKVMRAQRELVRIDRKLWPVLSFKGL